MEPGRSAPRVKARPELSFCNPRANQAEAYSKGKCVLSATNTMDKAPCVLGTKCPLLQPGQDPKGKGTGRRRRWPLEVVSGPALLQEPQLLPLRVRTLPAPPCSHHALQTPSPTPSAALRFVVAICTTEALPSPPGGSPHLRQPLCTQPSQKNVQSPPDLQ